MRLPGFKARGEVVRIDGHSTFPDDLASFGLKLALCMCQKVGPDGGKKLLDFRVSLKYMRHLMGDNLPDIY